MLINSNPATIMTDPGMAEPLQPLLTVLPLKLIACHAVLLRGCKVDKPRNLATSLTVE